MNVWTQFTIPGVALLLTLVFGFWLSRLGRPYNGVLFNVHKLLALGAVVAAVVQGIRSLRAANPVGPIAVLLVLLVLAAVCAVALFASGALMSMDKLNYALTLTIHRIAPVVLVIALILGVSLL